jgi:hypothetical protein
MKKLLILTILGLSLGGTAGCRVADCWKEAWNARFHPERNEQPCMMVEPCDPCSCDFGGTMIGGSVMTSPSGGSSCGCGR